MKTLRGKFGYGALGKTIGHVDQENGFSNSGEDFI